MNSGFQLNNQSRFKKVDHYQFLELLGKGAHGLVYKGLNAQDGSFVAIKQMIIGKSQMKTIKAELNFLKQLSHPSIVKYIDAVQKDNRIYLILEYIEGGSLGALVQKLDLNEETIKIYVRQLLVGLDFLHKKGVIHRDIKGANILITKHGKVKLADFGVAIKIQQLQKTLSVAGSPYWIAPEIILGDEPSSKCDIWSFGCTIIELITGNPPYYQLMPFPAVFRIVQDQHPPIPKCSEQCKKFLLKCFSKNPSQRPNASQLLSDPWLKTSQKLNNQTPIMPMVNNQILEDVQRVLSLPIDYEELLKLIIKLSPRLQPIYKNPLFYNFKRDCSHLHFRPQRIINSHQSLYDNKQYFSVFSQRRSRLRIICSLIKQNIAGMEYLDLTGFLGEQIIAIQHYLRQFIYLHEGRLPLSSIQIKQEYQLVSTISDLIRQVLIIYTCDQPSHCESCNHQNILPVILKYMLPLIGKIVVFFRDKYKIVKENKISKEELYIKKLLITYVYELIIVYQRKLPKQNWENHYPNSSNCKDHMLKNHEKTYLMFENFCYIFSEAAILEQIFNTDQEENFLFREEQIALYLLKLQIQLKIMPTLVRLSCKNNNFSQISKTLIRKSVKSLLKNSFTSKITKQLLSCEQRDQIFMGKMFLINTLAQSDIGRALLQRKGLISILADYFSKIQTTISQISQIQKLQLLEATQITQKMIFTFSNNNQVTLDQNRVLQFQRHCSPKLFEDIKIKLAKNSCKQKDGDKKSDNNNTLIQKISAICSQLFGQSRKQINS